MRERGPSRVWTRALAWTVVALAASGCAAPADVSPTAHRPASLAEPPPGTRWQGVGHVVVAVPTSWRTEIDPCTQPDGDVVLLPAVSRAVMRCAVSATRGVSSLVVSRASRSRALRCRSSVCRATFGDPDARVWFGVTARGTSARRLVAGVRNSLTRLPAGWTSVPAEHYGESVEHAVRQLEAASLRGTSPDVDWPHYVTGTRPVAGTVVAEGDTVELTIGDG